VSLATLVLLLVVACGGPSSDGDGPPPDDYIEQANAVCRAETERRAEPAEPKTAEEFVTELKVRIADVRRLQTALRKLDAPAEDRDDIEAWLDLGDRQVEALEGGLPAAEEAAKSGDLAATATAYRPAADKFAELSADDTFADDYGLTDCAEE
jgi:hypothetical protein